MEKLNSVNFYDYKYKFFSNIEISNRNDITTGYKLSNERSMKAFTDFKIFKSKFEELEFKYIFEDKVIHSLKCDVDFEKKFDEEFADYLTKKEKEGIPNLSFMIVCKYPIYREYGVNHNWNIWNGVW